MSRTAKCCLFFTVLIVLICVISMISENAYAEDSPDQEEEAAFLPMIEDIRDGVTDIKDILTEAKKADENYYQESINEQKSINDSLDQENEVDENDDDPVLNNDSGVSEVPEESDVSQEQNSAPEEGTTQVGEGLENGNDENAVVSDQTISREDILVLHSDLQKIMISMWALAGLYLGTKLISRMFGNG